MKEKKYLLKLLSKKGAIPYEIFKTGEELPEVIEFPSKECFVSKLELMKKFTIMLKKYGINLFAII